MTSEGEDREAEISSSEAARQILEDTESGAFELLEKSVELISALPDSDIEDFLSAVLRERYSMTPLVNLVNEIYLSREDEEDPITRAERYLETAIEGKDKVVENGKELLKRKGHEKIATMSYSSTVLQTLEDAEDVIIFESRPGMEGRKLAEKLLREGVDVDYYIDAAYSIGLENADAVLVGADTVTKKGFLNKIGTSPLACVSREKETPFYVAADTTKILPPEVPLSEGEKHPPEEVWSTDEDVTVHNEYFEFMRWDDRNMITADGVKKGSDLEFTDQQVSQRLLREHPLVDR